MRGCPRTHLAPCQPEVHGLVLLHNLLVPVEPLVAHEQPGLLHPGKEDYGMEYYEQVTE